MAFSRFYVSPSVADYFLHRGLKPLFIFLSYLSPLLYISSPTIQSFASRLHHPQNCAAMSWNYAVAQINQSLEQLALWYREFMHRTEQSFRAIHERVMFLEQRQAWKGPSDEQVERILRKILAERFADAGVQRVENPNVMKDSDYFVENPKEDAIIPKAIAIDVASLQVDAKAVPSKAYGQTLQMLESRLPGFPNVDLGKSGYDDPVQDPKDPSNEFKRPALPSDNRQQRKPWS